MAEVRTEPLLIYVSWKLVVPPSRRANLLIFRHPPRGNPKTGQEHDPSVDLEVRTRAQDALWRGETVKGTAIRRISQQAEIIGSD